MSTTSGLVRVVIYFINYNHKKMILQQMWNVIKNDFRRLDLIRIYKCSELWLLDFQFQDAKALQVLQTKA